MGKRTKVYICIVLVSLGVIFALLSRQKTSEENYITKNFIVTRIKSNLYLYRPILDSSSYNKFNTYYKNIVEQIHLNFIKGDEIIIGERTKVDKDTITVEIFTTVFNEKNSNFYIIRIKNGIFSQDKYSCKSKYPKYNISCNEHYFYLPQNSNNKYSAYSITLIHDNRLQDTKIFFSPNFDAFINVKCLCDESNLIDIIKYVDTQLENPHD